MAYTVEEISAIVKQYAEKTKAWRNRKKASPYDNIEKKSEGVSQYPEYWVGYNYAAKMYDSIETHTSYEYFPEHLFSVRAPNQDEKQAKWIRANYKPTTMPVYEDFKATVTRAFADQNWRIDYKPEADERFGDESFEEYVNKQIDNFGSIEMFVKSMLPALKIKDANGIIALYPETIPVTEDGETLSNELVKPQPYYYSCKRIVGKEDDKYFMVVSQYRSKVKVGSKYETTGEVLMFFDDQNIWKVYQTGKKDDFIFSEPELFYNHDIGYVPCTQLMGTPLLIDNNVVYQSPFITSVPILDQVVLDNSYLNLSKATSAFPFMVALGETCNFTNQDGSICNDGQILNGEKYSTCPACNGAGVRSRFSPSGVLLIKPKTSVSEGDTGLSGEYIKFVSPPMDTLNFLRKEIDEGMNKARGIIHINTSDAAVSGDEARTATGSLNKLRSLYAFIKPISDQMFMVWEFMLNTIGDMRYGEFFGSVEVVYPTTFDIMTPSDYLGVISQGIEANVPPSVSYANVYNYLKAIHYTDKESNAMYELILAADELLLMNSADIALRVANGTVEKWQDVLHNSAPQLIMELIREYVPRDEASNFYDLPLQEQINLLRDKAVSKVTEQLDPFTQAQRIILNGNA
jgi:hypothetical protein